MAKDYYKILGVTKTASKDEIKKAFHKLAHKYHPDKNTGNEAQFKEVNEAYQVLSNDKKRAEYDMYGNVFQGGNAGQGGGFNQANWNDFDFSGFTGGGQGFEFDLGDIFGDFFNGGGGQGGGRRVKRGRDISVDIQISFAEAVFGTERKILINKVSECDNCRGTGAEKNSAKKSCATCAGKGKINEMRKSFIGTFNTVRECQTCRGTGEIAENPCKICRGEGVLKKNEEIGIKIPAGIQNGEMVRLTGKGEAVAGGVAGDLYLKVHVDKHPTFKREGNDLVMSLDIKLSDALLGRDYTIPTLDGDINLKVPEGVSFGEVLRVKNKGIPTGGNKRGDLLVKIVINTPKKLSKKARELIDKLKEEGM